MTGEMKRMLTGKSFLAAWLIACLSLAAGASYPNLKKVLECGTFLRLLNGSLGKPGSVLCHSGGGCIAMERFLFAGI